MSATARILDSMAYGVDLHDAVAREKRKERIAYVVVSPLAIAPGPCPGWRCPLLSDRSVVIGTSRGRRTRIELCALHADAALDAYDRELPIDLPLAAPVAGNARPDVDRGVGPGILPAVRA